MDRSTRTVRSEHQAQGARPGPASLPLPPHRLRRAVAIVPIARPLAYAQAHASRFCKELMALIRFPTVSAQPEHAADLVDCARWLADHLRGIGLEHAQVSRTEGHPLVYADWLHAAGKPTVLIYGHYDVQPADPLDQWQTPPFQPAIRGLYLYGRGASDDKGQFFAHLKAIDAYLRTTGSLPTNVKVILEGEEEIGSASLLAFARQHPEALAADVAVVSDTSIPAPDRPALTYALRGSLSLELEVRGLRGDVHSGTYGGAVREPLQALCAILDGLYARGGCITIRGFYGRVRLPDPDERAYLVGVGPTNEEILAGAGASRGWGEPGFTLYESTTLRPSLSVHGISGGYQGPGIKTVIPAIAAAKLSFRLVPDQEPDEVDRLFRQHIARTIPPGVRCTVRTLDAARPVVMERGHPALRAAEVAYRRGFGASPVFLRSGGTIPVVSTLQNALGISTVLMGLALADDAKHGPNERFYLPNLANGIRTSIYFLVEVGSGVRRHA